MNLDEDFLLLSGEEEEVVLVGEIWLGMLEGASDADADADGLEAAAAVTTAASLLCLQPMIYVRSKNVRAPSLSVVVVA